MSEKNTQAEAPSERELWSAIMRWHRATDGSPECVKAGDEISAIFTAALATQQAGQGEAVAINYVILHDFAQRKRVSYNELCVAVNDAIKSMATPSAPQQAEAQSYTYASTQATNCAGCGKHKHTPLRIDAMGGYVCLTCIDKKLGGLLGEFGYEDEQPEALAQQERDREDAENYRWLCSHMIVPSPSLWDKGVAFTTPPMPRKAGQMTKAELDDFIRAARSSEGGQP